MTHTLQDNVQCTPPLTSIEQLKPVSRLAAISGPSDACPVFDLAQSRRYVPFKGEPTLATLLTTQREQATFYRSTKSIKQLHSFTTP